MWQGLRYAARVKNPNPIQLNPTWRRQDKIFVPNGGDYNGDGNDDVEMGSPYEVAISRNDQIHVVDIDPATGKVTPVAAAPMGSSSDALRVRFDGSASTALVDAGPSNERSALLLTLDGSPQAAIHTLATVANQVNMEAGLLADDRIAVIVRQPPVSELRIFSKTGDPLLTIPLGQGFAIIGSEPFPNVLMVSTMASAVSNVRLFDTTSGKLLRQVDGFRAPRAFFASISEPAPPASAGSRLLLKGEALYLLPSMTEAPRQLLPRP